jgi:hypothetical protein
MKISKEEVRAALSAWFGVKIMDANISEFGQQMNDTLHAALTVRKRLKAERKAASKIDRRPPNCRFRLKDEYKPYPRSGCKACGKNIMTGLGGECSLVTSIREQGA